MYTVENPEYQFYDPHNFKDVPEGIEVLKRPSPDPIRIFKKLSGRRKEEPLLNIVQASQKKRTFIDMLGIWVRGNFFIPDARALWIRPSVRFLKKYLQENPVDAILTDGPPHTNTVIGLKLSKALGIPWLADFQDPWTQVDYYEQMLIGKRADRKHRSLEQEVFKTAKKITIASPAWKFDLEKIGAANVDVVYYGYDEEDFADFRKRKGEHFKIFHAGLIGNDRNPEILFEVLRELIDENREFEQVLMLSFAGEVDYEVVRAVEKNDLGRMTEFLGMMSRRDVFKHYEEASLLMLPINKAKNASGRIPGKLYEYMRALTPILAFGPEHGNVRDIVEGRQLGAYFTYLEKSRLKEYLKGALNDFINGREIPLSPVDYIRDFSNESQTKKIAEYLDELSR